MIKKVYKVHCVYCGAIKEFESKLDAIRYEQMHVMGHEYSIRANYSKEGDEQERYNIFDDLRSDN